MPVNEDLIVFSEFDRDFAYKATLQLLDKYQPDAIFAVSDRLAIGALLALRTRGVQLPQEVAIVGFNDETIMSLLTPAVSSVAQPAFEMGRTATKLLIEQINSDTLMPPRTIIVKPELIVRESLIRR